MGGDLPLILPSKLGGYWIDPPLERLVDVSPTGSYYGLDPNSYDIMERDKEAKIYQEFFSSRVSRLYVKSHMISLCLVFMFHRLFFLLVPSLIHSSRSISGTTGSLCVFGGRGKQAAGDTKVEIIQLLQMFELHRAELCVCRVWH